MREVDGERDVMTTTLPAIFTAQQGLGELRYPSLKGIMGAKKKPITDWDAAALGVAVATVGAAGAKIHQFVTDFFETFRAPFGDNQDIVGHGLLIANRESRAT